MWHWNCLGGLWWRLWGWSSLSHSDPLALGWGFSPCTSVPGCGHASAQTLPRVQNAAVLLAYPCQLWNVCHPSRLLVPFLFTWDPGIKTKCKYTTGAGQDRGGCSGGRECCHERSHFWRLFCKLCSSPVYKLCWREGLISKDVRLFQGRVVFLRSSILCCIWEESLNYSVTCITACKSVYNQGLGFCPYLWMTRAESGRNSSTDTVCELHNCCGYMTLLLHTRPWDGWDIWQGLCSLLWTAHAQLGLLLLQARKPGTLRSPSSDLATISG